MLQQIRQNSPQVADAIQRGDFSMSIVSVPRKSRSLRS